MVRTADLIDSQGALLPLYVGDDITGYSTHDIITDPEAYAALLQAYPGSNIYIAQLEGNIGSYKTILYGLVWVSTHQPEPITNSLSRLLSVQDTARMALLQAEPLEEREKLELAIKCIKESEQITSKTYISLPEEALEFLSDEDKASMKAAKQEFELKAIDNQDVFQKNFDSEFCIMLPTIDEIHQSNGFNFNNLDILRNIMPCRKPGNRTEYFPLYHTPYYKIDYSTGRTIPAFLSWLEGFNRNNLLDIQPNERRMQKNLQNLYKADITRYTEGILTHIFFKTKLGLLFLKVPYLRERDTITEILADINALLTSSEEFKAYNATDIFHISLSEIENLWEMGWTQNAVINQIVNNLHLPFDYLKSIADACGPGLRVINPDNNRFTLSFPEDQINYFTDYFIENGFMTDALRRFFVQLCQYAYQVNWGHTGTAGSISCLTLQANILDMRKLMTDYINIRLNNEPFKVTDFIDLYADSYQDPTTADSDVDFDSFTASTGGDDSQGVAYNHYLSETTLKLLQNSGDGASVNIVNSKFTGAESSSDKIIERYRSVNGDDNISSYLEDAYNITLDPNVFIETFIKLLRWGDRKPRTLILASHELPFVFDLNNGQVTSNRFTVNEELLVKHNGCDFSFDGILYSNSNEARLSSTTIIGFVLNKTYQVSKDSSEVFSKRVLASWDDMVELLSAGAINIAEFKAITPLNKYASTPIYIEKLESEEITFYESKATMSEALKRKCKAVELSQLFLLTQSSILNTRNYTNCLKPSFKVISQQHVQLDILRRYVTDLNKFYAKYSVDLEKLGTTADLSKLVALYHNFKEQGGATVAAKDHNQTVANSTLQAMNLGGTPVNKSAYSSSSTSSPNSLAQVRYLNDELEGKFILMVDRFANLPDLPAMKFTNPVLQKISSRLNDSIIFLLLEKKDKWLICRKDLRDTEVDTTVKNGKRVINTQVYANQFEKLFKLVVAGRVPKISGKPVYLHESMREAVQSVDQI